MIIKGKWKPSSFLIFLFQLIATGLGLFVVDRAGRRILLMISIGIMGVTITGLSTYFYLSENNHDVSNLGRCKRLKNKIIITDLYLMMYIKLIVF